jgi:predicted secreted Zn-dependent protease
LWWGADTYFERFNGMWQNLDMKLTSPIYINGKQWLKQSLISEIGEIFHSITEELEIDGDSAVMVTKSLILKREGKQIDHDERTEKIYVVLNKFLDEVEAAIKAQKEIDEKLKSYERDQQHQRDD